MHERLWRAARDRQEAGAPGRHLKVDRLLRHRIAERVGDLYAERLAQRRPYRVQLIVAAEDA